MRTPNVPPLVPAKVAEVKRPTRPNAEQLEVIAKVPPHLRDYIQAVIRDALANVRTPPAPTPAPCTECRKITPLAARVAELERRYAEDDKYALTRAKLITFMDKAGIK